MENGKEPKEGMASIFTNLQNSFKEMQDQEYGA